MRRQLDAGGAGQHPHATLGQAIVLPGIGQSSCTEVMLMIRPPPPCAIICFAAI
jgi:hypothetical protein